MSGAIVQGYAAKDAMMGGVGSFRALMAEDAGDGIEAVVRTLDPTDLPSGEVTVRVAYSGINYKDALAVTGKGRILRSTPMVPGIDLVGEVVETTSGVAGLGDQVLINGYGIGEDHWGGFAEFARVKGEWLVPLPKGLTSWQAAAIGTAGYTAMLSVMALEEHGLSRHGPEGPHRGDSDLVVVTGATGGVGSYAVALLSAAGSRVVASTGRADLAEYLSGLGAAEVVDRGVLEAAAGRPLGSERWAGAVDTVGGATLAGLIATMRRHASIASCGLAGGHDLKTTVFPFILRGVNLLGIDSNYCEHERRVEAWGRLARDLRVDLIEAIVARTVGLEDVAASSRDLLEGRVHGRIVVEVSG